MRKNFIIFTSIIFVILFVTSVSAITGSERSCLSECSQDIRNDRVDCSTDYRECRNECNDNYRICLGDVRSDYAECKEECGNDRDCRRACYTEYRDDRSSCDRRSCTDDCKDDRNLCLDNVKEELSECKNQCVEIASQEIERDFVVSESSCEEAGGFFQQLCKGTYFGIVCRQESYCHCEGVGDYSCPENYECVKDFDLTVRGRGLSLPGWKTLLGQDLGDVGLCAVSQNPSQV